ncbi:TIGR03767 family metallophosphoesterase [Streptomyces lonegramiae]|uniref:TIGR03767 family metallophosphoesterase n=1 Tax=Streptomyces lonegramiae TaxID=3075524 RepID=A0ABU2X987_9ACTN|nr:TIGR03767 family metallophosphoesterase [Streptomyces sp. DSM 41529]MDT0542066.1 TIGR03767 family metallophosphoesterase [Streptomyces sp. DSM 41529]
MSRIRSAAHAALDRRTLLVAAASAGAATGLGFAFGPGGGSATASQPARVSAAGRRVVTAPSLPSEAGTTLETFSAPRGTGAYRRLGDGPAWARTVRTELAGAKSGREARRTTVASFVQLTDLHLTDVQHPLRYEFLRAGRPGAWRPHEALTVVGAASLIERVNGLRGGPATGSPLSFVMTTGDNTDNNARIELDWFLGVMNGGRITPNTGDPRRYEGVQNSGIKAFWHPDSALRDADKQAGFPRIEGFLAAALRTVNSPGLRLPWYSTIGNHDDLAGGVYSFGGNYFADLATGSRKLQIIPAAEAADRFKDERKGGDPTGTVMKDLLRAHTKDMRTVTPDERRAPISRHDYLAAHLSPAHTGPGPVGHGYTEANLDEGTCYYSFRISDGVLGISLDTTDPGGHYTGSLGTAQLRWLERTLKAHKDDRILVFSHHYSRSMDNLNRDPARSGEARHGGDEVVALFKRHPQVLAWINGHSHKNEITPRSTFWEITTASHVDFPQLARVIEVVDNHDGTLSLFTTLIESAAPRRTDYSDLSQTGLAALYRELSYNAPGRSQALAGDADDRNTELLLRKA